MSRRYISAEVDVDISEFDTEDLLEELKERGEMTETDVTLSSLYEALRNNRTEEVQTLLRKYMWDKLGRVL